MKTALLGASGQLGTEIRKIIDTEPLTRENYSIDEPFEKCAELLLPYDTIINATAYTNVEKAESEIEQTFKINAKFPGKLAEYCKKHKKTLIHFSTDYVFNGEKTVPYKENDIPAPINIYGKSKFAGEFLVSSSCKKFFIFRLSSLFGKAGASGKGGNFIETMLKMAKENKKIRVISDQTMSPTYAADAAEMIKSFLVKNEKTYGTYHFANRGTCSWFDFASKIFEIEGIKPDINAVTSKEFITKALRPAYSVLDTSKISLKVKIRRWEEALEHYISERNS